MGIHDRYQRFFAWALARSGRQIESAVAVDKQALLADLSGTVLEIGPGAGANLRYFPPDVRWIGVEPNRHLRRYLDREAARLGREIELLHSGAEHIDLPAASVDAAVSTHVLCSVDDLAAVVAEVARVLKPGGRFVFVEHVAAPRGTRLRRLQNLAQPLWTLAGEGCHPNRETWRAIEAGGFTRVDIERFTIRAPLVAPHIKGTAWK